MHCCDVVVTVANWVAQVMRWARRGSGRDGRCHRAASRCKSASAAQFRRSSCAGGINRSRMPCSAASDGRPAAVKASLVRPEDRTVSRRACAGTAAREDGQAASAADPRYAADAATACKGHRSRHTRRPECQGDGPRRGHGLAMMAGHERIPPESTAIAASSGRRCVRRCGHQRLSNLPHGDRDGRGDPQKAGVRRSNRRGSRQHRQQGDGRQAASIGDRLPPGHYRVASGDQRTVLKPHPLAQSLERLTASLLTPSTCDPGARRWLVRAQHAARRAGAAVGNGCAVAQHHVQEVHAAGGAVHGGARLQQSGRLHVSPLRGPADHGGPVQTDHAWMARRSELRV